MPLIPHVSARAFWPVLIALALAGPAPVTAQAANLRVADPASPTILITGSNRGIGLALAQHYANVGWNVIATCRTPAEAEELKALARDNPKVLVEPLDVTDLGQVDALAKRLAGAPIDVLFNNAAVLGDLDAQKLGGLDYGQFERVMATNVFGPLKLSEALADNVAASNQKKIIGMTSGLGSLKLMGRMSGFYYYRMSKAALNMGMLGLRADLKGRGIVVGILAPGMVDTDLLYESGYRGKSLTPEESAAGLATLVEKLGPDDPGIPINVDGKPIPW